MSTSTATHAEVTVKLREIVCCLYRLTVTDEALPVLPVAVDVVDRATEVFFSVGEWLARSAVQKLIESLGREIENRLSTRTQEWLHLHEELPVWLLPLINSDVALPALDPRQADLLRAVLKAERILAEFNFRRREGVAYVERSQASNGDLSHVLADQIVRLAPAMGLIDPQPPRQHGYDMTLVLGGGYSSPLLRARYAAKVKASGTDLGVLYFLGSPRFLITDPPEREVTVTYAPYAVDEFGLMLAAAKAEFGLQSRETTFVCGCAEASRPCPAWQHRVAARADETPPEFTHERRADLTDAAGKVVGSVLSASTGRPPYRPDTSDTFALWSRCAQPAAQQRVLVVTTQVFVPFQTFEGHRRLYLPFGLDVDTVGFGADWGDRPQTAEFLLQETLSAMRSARRLLVTASEILMSRSQAQGRVYFQGDAR